MFRWSLIEITVIYVIEVAIINLLFLSVGLVTPQPVDHSDGGSCDGEPTQFQPIDGIPPVYWRNIEFIGRRALVSGVFIGFILTSVIPRYGLDSDLSLSVGLAIASTVFFQLTRVWRHFLADRSYRDRSPADAIDFAFAPAVELYLMVIYVVAPVTILLAGIAFAMDTSLDSRHILLLYLVPMGVIRAWIGSLDPQTDDIEISFN